MTGSSGYHKNGSLPEQILLPKEISTNKTEFEDLHTTPLQLQLLQNSIEARISLIHAYPPVIALAAEFDPVLTEMLFKISGANLENLPNLVKWVCTYYDNIYQQLLHQSLSLQWELLCASPEFTAYLIHHHAPSAHVIACALEPYTSESKAVSNIDAEPQLAGLLIASSSELIAASLSCDSAYARRLLRNNPELAVFTENENKNSRFRDLLNTTRLTAEPLSEEQKIAMSIALQGASDILANAGLPSVSKVFKAVNICIATYINTSPLLMGRMLVVGSASKDRWASFHSSHVAQAITTNNNIRNFFKSNCLQIMEELLSNTPRRILRFLNQQPDDLHHFFRIYPGSLLEHFSRPTLSQLYWLIQNKNHLIATFRADGSSLAAYLKDFPELLTRIISRSGYSWLDFVKTCPSLTYHNVPEGTIVKENNAYNQNLPLNDRQEFNKPILQSKTKQIHEYSKKVSEDDSHYFTANKRCSIEAEQLTLQLLQVIREFDTTTTYGISAAIDRLLTLLRDWYSDATSNNPVWWDVADSAFYATPNYLGWTLHIYILKSIFFLAHIASAQKAQVIFAALATHSKPFTSRQFILSVSHRMLRYILGTKGNPPPTAPEATAIAAMAVARSDGSSHSIASTTTSLDLLYLWHHRQVHSLGQLPWRNVEGPPRLPIAENLIDYIARWAVSSGRWAYVDLCWAGLAFFEGSRGGVRLDTSVARMDKFLARNFFYASDMKDISKQSDMPNEFSKEMTNNLNFDQHYGKVLETASELELSHQLDLHWPQLPLSSYNLELSSKYQTLAEMLSKVTNNSPIMSSDLWNQYNNIITTFFSNTSTELLKDIEDLVSILKKPIKSFGLQRMKSYSGICREVSASDSAISLLENILSNTTSSIVNLSVSTTSLVCESKESSITNSWLHRTVRNSFSCINNICMPTVWNMINTDSIALRQGCAKQSSSKLPYLFDYPDVRYEIIVPPLKDMEYLSSSSQYISDSNKGIPNAHTFTALIIQAAFSPDLIASRDSLFCVLAAQQLGPGIAPLLWYHAEKYSENYLNEIGYPIIKAKVVDALARDTLPLLDSDVVIKPLQSDILTTQIDLPSTDHIHNSIQSWQSEIPFVSRRTANLLIRSSDKSKKNIVNSLFKPKRKAHKLKIESIRPPQLTRPPRSDAAALELKYHLAKQQLRNRQRGINMPDQNPSEIFALPGFLREALSDEDSNFALLQGVHKLCAQTANLLTTQGPIDAEHALEKTIQQVRKAISIAISSLGNLANSDINNESLKNAQSIGRNTSAAAIALLSATDGLQPLAKEMFKSQLDMLRQSALRGGLLSSVACGKNVSHLVSLIDAASLDNNSTISLLKQFDDKIVKSVLHKDLHKVWNQLVLNEAVINNDNSKILNKNLKEQEENVNQTGVCSNGQLGLFSEDNIDDKEIISNILSLSKRINKNVKKYKKVTKRCFSKKVYHCDVYPDYRVNNVIFSEISQEAASLQMRAQAAAQLSQPIANNSTKPCDGYLKENLELFAFARVATTAQVACSTHTVPILAKRTSMNTLIIHTLSLNLLALAHSCGIISRQTLTSATCHELNIRYPDTACKGLVMVCDGYYIWKDEAQLLASISSGPSIDMLGTTTNFRQQNSTCLSFADESNITNKSFEQLDKNPLIFEYSNTSKVNCNNKEYDNMNSFKMENFDNIDKNNIDIFNHIDNNNNNNNNSNNNNSNNNNNINNSNNNNINNNNSNININNINNSNNNINNNNNSNNINNIDICNDLIFASNGNSLFQSNLQTSNSLFGNQQNSNFLNNQNQSTNLTMGTFGNSQVTNTQGTNLGSMLGNSNGATQGLFGSVNNVQAQSIGNTSNSLLSGGQSLFSQKSLSDNKLNMNQQNTGLSGLMGNDKNLFGVKNQGNLNNSNNTLFNSQQTNNSLGGSLFGNNNLQNKPAEQSGFKGLNLGTVPTGGLNNSQFPQSALNGLNKPFGISNLQNSQGLNTFNQGNTLNNQQNPIQTNLIQNSSAGISIAQTLRDAARALQLPTMWTDELDQRAQHQAPIKTPQPEVLLTSIIIPLLLAKELAIIFDYISLGFAYFDDDAIAEIRSLCSTSPLPLDVLHLSLALQLYLAYLSKTLSSTSNQNISPMKHSYNFFPSFADENNRPGIFASSDVSGSNIKDLPQLPTAIDIHNIIKRLSSSTSQFIEHLIIDTHISNVILPPTALLLELIARGPQPERVINSLFQIPYLDISILSTVKPITIFFKGLKLVLASLDVILKILELAFLRNSKRLDSPWSMRLHGIFATHNKDVTEWDIVLPLRSTPLAIALELSIVTHSLRLDNTTLKTLRSEQATVEKCNEAKVSIPGTSYYNEAISFLRQQIAPIKQGQQFLGIGSKLGEEFAAKQSYQLPTKSNDLQSQTIEYNSNQIDSKNDSYNRNKHLDIPDIMSYISFASSPIPKKRNFFNFANTSKSCLKPSSFQERDTKIIFQNSVNKNWTHQGSFVLLYENGQPVQYQSRVTREKYQLKLPPVQTTITAFHIQCVDDSSLLLMYQKQAYNFYKCPLYKSINTTKQAMLGCASCSVAPICTACGMCDHCNSIESFRRGLSDLVAKLPYHKVYTKSEFNSLQYPYNITSSNEIKEDSFLCTYCQYLNGGPNIPWYHHPRYKTQRMHKEFQNAEKKQLLEAKPVHINIGSVFSPIGYSIDTLQSHYIQQVGKIYNYKIHPDLVICEVLQPFSTFKIPLSLREFILQYYYFLIPSIDLPEAYDSVRLGYSVGTGYHSRSANYAKFNSDSETLKSLTEISGRGFPYQQPLLPFWKPLHNIKYLTSNLQNSNEFRPEIFNTNLDSNDNKKIFNEKNLNFADTYTPANSPEYKNSPNINNGNTIVIYSATGSKPVALKNVILKKDLNNEPTLLNDKKNSFGTQLTSSHRNNNYNWPKSDKDKQISSLNNNNSIHPAVHTLLSYRLFKPLWSWLNLSQHSHKDPSVNLVISSLLSYYSQNPQITQTSSILKTATLFEPINYSHKEYHIKFLELYRSRNPLYPTSKEKILPPVYKQLTPRDILEKFYQEGKISLEELEEIKKYIILKGEKNDTIIINTSQHHDFLDTPLKRLHIPTIEVQDIIINLYDKTIERKASHSKNVLDLLSMPLKWLKNPLKQVLKSSNNIQNNNQESIKHSTLADNQDLLNIESPQELSLYGVDLRTYHIPIHELSEQIALPCNYESTIRFLPLTPLHHNPGTSVFTLPGPLTFFGSLPMAYTLGNSSRSLALTSLERMLEAPEFRCALNTPFWVKALAFSFISRFDPLGNEDIRQYLEYATSLKIVLATSGAKTISTSDETLNMVLANQTEHNTESSKDILGKFNLPADEYETIPNTSLTTTSLSCNETKYQHTSYPKLEHKKRDIPEKRKIDIFFASSDVVPSTTKSLLYPFYNEINQNSILDNDNINQTKHTYRDTISKAILENIAPKPGSITSLEYQGLLSSFGKMLDTAIGDVVLSVSIECEGLTRLLGLTVLTEILTSQLLLLSSLHSCAKLCKLEDTYIEHSRDDTYMAQIWSNIKPGTSDIQKTPLLSSISSMDPSKMPKAVKDFLQRSDLSSDYDIKVALQGALYGPTTSQGMDGNALLSLISSVATDNNAASAAQALLKQQPIPTCNPLSNNLYQQASQINNQISKPNNFSLMQNNQNINQQAHSTIYDYFSTPYSNDFKNSLQKSSRDTLNLVLNATEKSDLITDETKQKLIELKNKQNDLTPCEAASILGTLIQLQSSKLNVQQNQTLSSFNQNNQITGQNLKPPGLFGQSQGLTGGLFNGQNNVNIQTGLSQQGLLGGLQNKPMDLNNMGKLTDNKPTGLNFGLKPTGLTQGIGGIGQSTLSGGQGLLGGQNMQGTGLGQSGIFGTANQTGITTGLGGLGQNQQTYGLGQNLSGQSSLLGGLGQNQNTFGNNQNRLGGFGQPATGQINSQQGLTSLFGQKLNTTDQTQKLNGFQNQGSIGLQQNSMTAFGIQNNQNLLQPGKINQNSLLGEIQPMNKLNQLQTQGNINQGFGFGKTNNSLFGQQGSQNPTQQTTPWGTNITSNIGNNFNNQTGQQSSLLGTNQNNLFGKTTSPFGITQQNTFGQQQPNNQQNTLGFNQQSNFSSQPLTLGQGNMNQNIFGGMQQISTLPNMNNQSSVGNNLQSNSFGNNAQPTGFGNSLQQFQGLGGNQQANGFGLNSQAQNGLTTQSNVFQTNNQSSFFEKTQPNSLFGNTQNSTNIQGMQNNSLFGANKMTTGFNNGMNLGNNLTGTNQQSTMFGAPQQNNLFGNTQQNNPFGGNQTNNVFSSNQQKNTINTTQQNGLFNSNTQQSNMFGFNQQNTIDNKNATGGFLNNQANNAFPLNSNNLFGNNNQSTGCGNNLQMNGFGMNQQVGNPGQQNNLFGASNQQNPGGTQQNFGMTQQNSGMTQQNTFGFNQNSATGFSGFGNMPLGNQQQSQNFNNNLQTPSQFNNSNPSNNIYGMNINGAQGQNNFTGNSFFNSNNTNNSGFANGNQQAVQGFGNTSNNMLGNANQQGGMSMFGNNNQQPNSVFGMNNIGNSSFSGINKLSFANNSFDIKLRSKSSFGIKKIIKYYDRRSMSQKLCPNKQSNTKNELISNLYPLSKVGNNKLHFADTNLSQTDNNIKTDEKSDIINDKLPTMENIKTDEKSDINNDKLPTMENIKTDEKSDINNDKLPTMDNIKTDEKSDINNDKLPTMDNIKTDEKSGINNDKLLTMENIKTDEKSGINNDKLLTMENIKIDEKSDVNNDQLQISNLITINENNNQETFDLSNKFSSFTDQNKDSKQEGKKIKDDRSLDSVGTGKLNENTDIINDNNIKTPYGEKQNLEKSNCLQAISFKKSSLSDSTDRSKSPAKLSVGFAPDTIIHNDRSIPQSIGIDTELPKAKIDISEQTNTKNPKYSEIALSDINNELLSNHINQLNENVESQREIATSRLSNVLSLISKLYSSLENYTPSFSTLSPEQDNELFLAPLYKIAHNPCGLYQETATGVFSDSALAHLLRIRTQQLELALTQYLVTLLNSEYLSYPDVKLLFASFETALDSFAANPKIVKLSPSPPNLNHLQSICTRSTYAEEYARRHISNFCDFDSPLIHDSDKDSRTDTTKRNTERNCKIADYFNNSKPFEGYKSTQYDMNKSSVESSNKISMDFASISNKSFTSNCTSKYSTKITNEMSPISEEKILNTSIHRKSKLILRSFKSFSNENKYNSNNINSQGIVGDLVCTDRNSVEKIDIKLNRSCCEASDRQVTSQTKVIFADKELHNDPQSGQGHKFSNKPRDSISSNSSISININDAPVNQAIKSKTTTCTESYMLQNDRIPNLDKYSNSNISHEKNIFNETSNSNTNSNNNKTLEHDTYNFNHYLDQNNESDLRPQKQMRRTETVFDTDRRIAESVDDIKPLANFGEPLRSFANLPVLYNNNLVKEWQTEQSEEFDMIQFDSTYPASIPLIKEVFLSHGWYSSTHVSPFSEISAESRYRALLAALSHDPASILTNPSLPVKVSNLFTSSTATDFYIIREITLRAAIGKYYFALNTIANELRNFIDTLPILPRTSTQILLALSKTVASVHSSFATNLCFSTQYSAITEPLFTTCVYDLSTLVQSLIQVCDMDIILLTQLRKDSPQMRYFNARYCSMHILYILSVAKAQISEIVTAVGARSELFVDLENITGIQLATWAKSATAEDILYSVAQLASKQLDQWDDEKRKYRPCIDMPRYSSFNAITGHAKLVPTIVEADNNTQDTDINNNIHTTSARGAPYKNIIDRFTFADSSFAPNELYKPKQTTSRDLDTFGSERDAITQLELELMYNNSKPCPGLFNEMHEKKFALLAPIGPIATESIIPNVTILLQSVLNLLYHLNEFDVSLPAQQNFAIVLHRIVLHGRI